MGERSEYAEDLAAELGYREAGLREVQLRDWYVDGSAKERAEFKRLIGRLRQKKYWAAKDPDRKARIKAYRAAWAREHRERCNELTRKRRKAHGRHPGDIASRKRRRAAERLERHANTVHECEVCGARWCTPVWRELPKSPPKYCGLRCRNRAAVQRRKAAGLCIQCAHPARVGRVTCARHRSSAATRREEASDD